MHVGFYTNMFRKYVDAAHLGFLYPQISVSMYMSKRLCVCVCVCVCVCADVYMYVKLAGPWLPGGAGHEDVRGSPHSAGSAHLCRSAKSDKEW